MTLRLAEPCDSPEFHPAHCKCPPPYNCVFCEIIRLGNAQEFERHGYTAVSFIPLKPVTQGHRLFVPTQHSKDFSEDPGHAAAAFYHAGKHAAEKGVHFNLITSGGEFATQTIFHTHIHYVPRREGDGLHLPWTKRIGDSAWR